MSTHIRDISFIFLFIKSHLVRPSRTLAIIIFYGTMRMFECNDGDISSSSRCSGQFLQWYKWNLEKFFHEHTHVVSLLFIIIIICFYFISSEWLHLPLSWTNWITRTHLKWARANIACLWYLIKLIEIVNILNFQMSYNQDSNGCFLPLFHNLNLNEWMINKTNPVKTQRFFFIVVVICLNFFIYMQCERETRVPKRKPYHRNWLWTNQTFKCCQAWKAIWILYRFQYQFT